MAATSYSTEWASIESRLQDNWATTAIAWEWEDFDANGAAHVEARIRTQEAFNAGYSATTKLVRHPGILLLTIRTPLLDTDGNPNGRGTASGYADTLCGLFRNVSFDNITFRAPTARPLGPDGPWYVVQVTCPFWRDSHLS